MSRRGWAVLCGWLALLGALAMLALVRLEVTGDLRQFMPAPRTADQRLLLDTLGEGPGSRLLLLAVSGGDPDTLAEHSRLLRDALLDQPALRQISNGEDDLSAFAAELLPYRYLLTPGFDQQPLNTETLRAALQARLQDLGSPAAGLVEPWIPSDPTLELLRLAEQWQPAAEPERYDGVWFTADHQRALLVAETAAGAFDPPAQRAAVLAIRAAHAELLTDAKEAAAVTLEVSGPGAFAVVLHERTQGEASRLGLIASLAILLLLASAYRSLRLPLLAALPVASAVLAALATVSLLFGSVHGITLAFGFTLLGLAQDYPVHLLSQQQRGRSADQAILAIWPTLLAGVVSTCLAYLAFVVAGVAGLTQLAAFAISGLLVAAASTRWLLPAVLPASGRDVADSATLGWLHRRVRQLPRLRAAVWLLGGVALLGLLGSDAEFWDDNLAHLTPVPAELLQRDQHLRQALGAPDVRYLLVVEAVDQEAVLQASEALQAPLQSLREHAVIAGFELPSQYLPSQRTQRARQAQLPSADALSLMIEQASAGLPFKRDLLAPFQTDIETARQAPLLTRDALADSPLAARLDALLPQRDAAALGLISLSGVSKPDALAALAAAQGPNVHLLDLKTAAESLSASYRQRVLWALAGAALLLLGSVYLLLRQPGRVLRVVAPVLLASLTVLALLHGGGVLLNLFHLVALILAAGVGLDYALFFEHAGHDPGDQRRTLHANGLCALSTALVFGLLASSSIPVLRAIGMTVALGVACQWLFAAIVAQARPSDSGSSPA